MSCESTTKPTLQYTEPGAQAREQESNSGSSAAHLMVLGSSQWHEGLGVICIVQLTLVETHLVSSTVVGSEDSEMTKLCILPSSVSQEVRR